MFFLPCYFYMISGFPFFFFEVPYAIVGRNYPGDGVVVAVLNCSLCVSNVSKGCLVSLKPFLRLCFLRLTKIDLPMSYLIKPMVCGVSGGGRPHHAVHCHAGRRQNVPRAVALERHGVRGVPRLPSTRRHRRRRDQQRKQPQVR